MVMNFLSCTFSQETDSDSWKISMNSMETKISVLSYIWMPHFFVLCHISTNLWIEKEFRSPRGCFGDYCTRKFSTIDGSWNELIIKWLILWEYIHCPILTVRQVCQPSHRWICDSWRASWVHLAMLRYLRLRYCLLNRLKSRVLKRCRKFKRFISLCW